MTLVAGCAIVTGGGSGIGRAIAETLARDGAAVGVVDLLPDGGRQTVESIAEAGGRAIFARADVSQWSDVDGVIGKLVASLGPLGILVNAAGILDGYAPVHAVTPAGRRGTVEEIAAAARFLASEEAGYITGHTLVIDGGWTAR